MALMDVLRLFDLNPEKIAAITADGYLPWLGRWIEWRKKNHSQKSWCQTFYHYLFILFFTNQAWQLRNPFVPVYKIMNSKWRSVFTNRPSNYVNNFCSPIWLPVIEFSSQITFVRWNSDTYDAYLWSVSYQTRRMPFILSDKRTSVLYFHFWFTLRRSTERQKYYRIIGILVSFLLCSVVYSLISLPGLYLTFKLLLNTHTHPCTHSFSFIHTWLF